MAIAITLEDSLGGYSLQISPTPKHHWALDSLTISNPQCYIPQKEAHQVSLICCAFFPRGRPLGFGFATALQAGFRCGCPRFGAAFAFGFPCTLADALGSLGSAAGGRGRGLNPMSSRNCFMAPSGSFKLEHNVQYWRSKWSFQKVDGTDE